MRELKWDSTTFTTIILQQGKNMWPMITKHFMWLITFPGQPRKLRTHQSVNEEMLLVFSLCVFGRWEELGDTISWGNSWRKEKTCQVSMGTTSRNMEGWLDTARLTSHAKDFKSWKWKEWHRVAYKRTTRSRGWVKAGSLSAEYFRCLQSRRSLRLIHRETGKLGALLQL